MPDQEAIDALAEAWAQRCGKWSVDDGYIGSGNMLKFKNEARVLADELRSRGFDIVRKE